ncbi:hypothetical protein ACWGUL_31415, partial [Streptomyces albidoflavus]
MTLGCEKLNIGQNAARGARPHPSRPATLPAQPNVLATAKDLGGRTPFQAFKPGRLVALAGVRS